MGKEFIPGVYFINFYYISTSKNLDLVPVFGTLSALTSKVCNTYLKLKNEDRPKFIRTSKKLYTFFLEGPLCFVSVSGPTDLYESNLKLLKSLHDTLMLVLTDSIKSRLTAFPQMDIAPLIADLHPTLQTLQKEHSFSLSSVLDTVEVLPLTISARNTLQACLAHLLRTQFNLEKDMPLFFMCIARNRLAGLVYSHPNSPPLDPKDLHVLINFVSSQSSKAPIWIPICLPNLDSANFGSACIGHFEPIGEDLPSENTDGEAVRVSYAIVFSNIEPPSNRMSRIHNSIEAVLTSNPVPVTSISSVQTRSPSYLHQNDQVEATTAEHNFTINTPPPQNLEQDNNTEIKLDDSAILPTGETTRSEILIPSTSSTDNSNDNNTTANPPPPPPPLPPSRTESILNILFKVSSRRTRMSTISTISNSVSSLDMAASTNQILFPQPTLLLATPSDQTVSLSRLSTPTPVAANPTSASIHGGNGRLLHLAVAWPALGMHFSSQPSSVLSSMVMNDGSDSKQLLASFMRGYQRALRIMASITQGQTVVLRRKRDVIVVWASNLPSVSPVANGLNFFNLGGGGSSSPLAGAPNLFNKNSKIIFMALSKTVELGNRDTSVPDSGVSLVNDLIGEKVLKDCEEYVTNAESVFTFKPYFCSANAKQ